MRPGEAYTMWRRIAVVRRQEGDTPGSRQAARNARIYANRGADGTINPPRYRIPRRIAGYVEATVQTDVDRYECDAPTVPIPFETATSTVLVRAATEAVSTTAGTVPVVIPQEVRKMAKSITTERQTELDFLSNVGTLALAGLPEHTFKSESVGRNATGRVVIDGTEYSVFVTVVNRSTVTPKSDAAPAVEVPAQAEPVAEPVKAATKPRTRKTAAERKALAEVA